jgi:hypothetical protein
MGRESLPSNEEQESFSFAEDHTEVHRPEESHAPTMSDADDVYRALLAKEPDADDARKQELLANARQLVRNRQQRAAYRRREEKRRGSFGE